VIGTKGTTPGRRGGWSALHSAEGMALVVPAGSVVDTGGWLWGGEVPGGRGEETLAIPGYSNKLPNYLLACRFK